jgi:hypothetical protein
MRERTSGTHAHVNVNCVRPSTAPEYCLSARSKPPKLVTCKGFTLGVEPYSAGTEARSTSGSPQVLNQDLEPTRGMGRTSRPEGTHAPRKAGLIAEGRSGSRSRSGGIRAKEPVPRHEGWPRFCRWVQNTFSKATAAVMPLPLAVASQRPCAGSSCTRKSLAHERVDPGLPTGTAGLEECDQVGVEPQGDLALGRGLLRSALSAPAPREDGQQLRRQNLRSGPESPDVVAGQFPHFPFTIGQGLPAHSGSRSGRRPRGTF